jgi:lysophospholipase L1-like esterase
VLSVLCGCGEGAATPLRGPATDLGAAPKITRPDAPPDGAAATQPPAVALSAAGDAASPAESFTSGAPVGHLTGAPRLTHLFEALANLDDGRAHDDVRIVQYGDSHTASDLGVAVFRRVLQARFGDGGRGFAPIGKPWKGFIEDGIRGGMDKAFEPAKVKYKGGSFTGLGGCYGLLGVGVETSKGDTRAWTDVTARASHIEVDYAQGPAGGSFDVFIDGARAGRISTRSHETKGGYFAFDVPDASHRIEARTVGDGDVRLFGVTLDRPEAGIVVDTLGINGAQIFTPLRWSEACFAEQLQHADPDLVILAYGTNEAVEPGLTDAEYERAIVDLLGRVARAKPDASCLLLGPPDLARYTKGQDDWKTLPRILEIVAAQKRVADAAGCAFYDQMEAMGGPGSMAQWASEPEPRAGHDRIHLTRTGYAQLGTSFATDLGHGYDAWRAGKGLQPTSAPRTWGSAAR